MEQRAWVKGQGAWGKGLGVWRMGKGLGAWSGRELVKWRMRDNLRVRMNNERMKVSEWEELRDL